MKERASSVPPDDGTLSGTRLKESASPRTIDPKSLITGEITQPFLLEKKTPSDRPPPPEGEAASAPPAEAPTAADAEAEAPAQPRPRLDVARAARRLSVIVLFNATLYAAIAAAGVLRYLRDDSAIPEVVLAVVAGGVALWGALAAHHLFRASRGGANAGHELAGAFSNFRSIFVLKGTGLFLVLALSCFAFSAVFSLAALL